MKRLVGHEVVRRSVLFAISIVASTIVGFFSIPVLVSSIGASGWGHLAVMQSVCQLFAVVVAFGWGAIGPSMVSAAPVQTRKRMYVESLYFRGALALVALPLAYLVCGLLTGETPAAVALAVVSYVVPGLSAAWYFVGTNRPVAMFLCDAMPVILGQVAGLVAILFVPDVTVYLACTALFGVGGAAASAIFVLTRPEGPAGSRTRMPWLEIARVQAAGVSTTISASIWSAAPIVLVQALAPAALPVYAMVDRLMKYGILALAPVLQAVQGWVPEQGPEHVPHRARVAVRIGWGIGALGGLGLAGLSTPLSAVLTLGEATVPWGVAAIAGAAFLFEAVAQLTGLAVLVPLGGGRQLAVSSVATAVVGVPLIALLVWWAGLVGAVVGMLLVALGVALYRVAHARRLAAALSADAQAPDAPAQA
ncbi:hypothetical protein ABZ477_12650 [Microbacterium sp. NPDC019599]|uniref:hypothetical protein n=1 Tax=Microbacterium sp. NPDC019599 TaxID=3154690 RepID=UPI0033D99C9B